MEPLPITRYFFVSIDEYDKLVEMNRDFATENRVLREQLQESYGMVIKNPWKK